MFVAAMLSAAFKLESVKDIINAGLSEIPKNCRLSEAVRDTLHWCETLPSWELVWEKINESVGHYHGVHTINNAALIVMGLYFGENDFEKGIVCTVRGGWDTDCTGATVGGLIGLDKGSIPDLWTEPWQGRVLTAVSGVGELNLDDLVDRTCALVEKFSSSPDLP